MMERRVTVTAPDKPDARFTVLTERTDMTETMLVQMGLRHWFPSGLPEGAKVEVSA